MGPTPAAQPEYLPVPATAEAAPPEPPDPMWRARFRWFLRGTNQTQVGIGIESTLKLLGVDLAVLVQNVGIHASHHVDLGMARIALSGFQVAVIQL